MGHEKSSWATYDGVCLSVVGRREDEEDEAEAVEEAAASDCRGAVRRDDLREGETEGCMCEGLGSEEVLTTGEGGLVSSPAAARHSSGASMYFSTS